MPVSGANTGTAGSRGSAHAPPGTVVGPYVIGDYLGSGRFSNVYMAYRGTETEPLAIKIFKDEGAQVIAGYEFAVLRKMANPGSHVVRVFDVRESDVGWYIVSEFLDGETLAERIDTAGGNTDVSEVAQIGSDMLHALSMTHDHHIFHRDVKPENVILVEGRGAILFDFGVAATRYTQLSGLTWPYWPPGVREGAVEPDPDLFAVGIILCELLTGEHPYPRSNPHGGEAPNVTHLPPGLREVLGRAIGPDPEIRYDTAEQFLDALAPFVESNQEITVSRHYRYRRAELHIAAGELDEAAALCLPEWKRLTSRIDRERQIN
ncbi:MAG: serine/threonine protein kinase [Actinomycetia bacterium]|nr:serine/threonine protein kinase [Actinomycetes bacterium]